MGKTEKQISCMTPKKELLWSVFPNNSNDKD